MILTFIQFRQQLIQRDKKEILNHFNEIYECAVLTEHELKVCYLAYLWGNDYVLQFDDCGYLIKDEKKLGIDTANDFELTFEVEPEEGGGVDLGVTYDYYVLDKLFEKLFSTFK